METFPPTPLQADDPTPPNSFFRVLLNQLVPDTNFAIDNAHQTSFGIQGLGNNPGNDGLEGSTGVFLDGVYIGRPGMAALDLIDLDQIEVLRGPQGTLFGKNTTAGAVTITTQAPSFTYAALGEVSFGNYGYNQYEGTATGPLIDGLLAGRVTAFQTDRNGDVHDVTTGSREQLPELWSPASWTVRSLLRRAGHLRRDLARALLVRTPN